MALGKWHLTPYTAYTAAGPFDRWPLGMGFEKYYGFLGGETDQWAPLLIQDNHFIDVPKREGYHLTEDLVDQSIARIRDQQQVSTGRPFFTYLALGAAHALLHAPKASIAKYKGRFDQGLHSTHPARHRIDWNPILVFIAQPWVVTATWCNVHFRSLFVMNR